MGSDKRKGGQPRRKDIAAESSQRHKHKEPGTGLEILSGPSGGGGNSDGQDEDNARVWIEKK